MKQIKCFYMKTNSQRVSTPYEAPETEVIETVFETGILILSNETNTSSIQDLEEEDYSDSIWN